MFSGSLGYSLTSKTDPSPSTLSGKFHHLLMTNDLTSEELKFADSFLTANPQVLDFSTKEKNNSIHVICRYGCNIQMLELLYEHMKRRKKTHLLFALNKKHTSPLHFAAAYGTPDFVSALMSLIPPAKICHTIKSLNNFGCDVLSFGLSNKLYAKDIARLLEPFAAYTELLPATHLEKIGMYAASPDTLKNKILKENLTIAELIMRDLRSFITRSHSHPSNNTVGDFKELRTEIETLREFSHKYKKLPIKEYAKKIYELCKEHKIANCDEYAMAGLHLLIQNNPGKYGEVFHIKNGDHLFLVIDRDRFSDPNDYTTWGPNAVVCDPWSGLSYPAKELAEKLNYFYFYKNKFTQKEMSITGPYRPDYHKLHVQHTTPSITPEIKPRGRLGY
jgi:hypothetical protein